MPRKSKIRWSKNDSKKIANDVRVFNAKLTRTLKAHPEWVEYLPERKTTAEIKNNVETRQELKRELKSIERFMKKGSEAPLTSETGIKTTKWEKREVGLKVAQINRARTIERKKADVSTYKGTMGTIKNNNLLPKKYDIDKIKSSDWEKFVETVNKQIRSEYNEEKMRRYKANYINAIKNVFGTMGNEIIEIIEGIEPEKLIQMYYDDPVLQIDFVYDPLELYAIKENILEHLEDEK